MKERELEERLEENQVSCGYVSMNQIMDQAMMENYKFVIKKKYISR